MELNRIKVLAIASGGGHWQQLMMLRGAFDGCDTLYVTTLPDLLVQSSIERGVVVADCNRNSIRALFQCAFQAIALVLKFRPEIVISTGAAPGLFFILIGRLCGAKTVWIDSIANAEIMSGSGRVARHFASLCLTQWEHISGQGGALYAGEVL